MQQKSNQIEETAQTPDSQVIYGRNSVIETLKTVEAADTLYLSGADTDKALGYIVALAKQKGAVIKKVPELKLSKLCASEHHQGVALLCPVCRYCTLDELFENAAQSGEPPLFVVTDGIEDPHNLGAIIRTAECVGAHGVVIPKRGNCAVTSAVHRASAGACSCMKIARVSNLASAIRDMKKRGVFFYCADMDGSPAFQTDLTGPAALVVGSEGFGVSRLVKELCDITVSLPIRGQINSLNASVAAGVLLYEILRQRTQ